MVDLDRWGGVADEDVTLTGPLPDNSTTGEDIVPKVLVIDDDQEIHRLLRARLEARGYHVTAAASGEEGVTKLRESRPDLVFLDVAMSGMTGIDVLDVIRSQRLDVAVILTTAYSSEQVAIAALRHGADDYLRKPFDRGEFQAALDRTLSRLTMSRQNQAVAARIGKEASTTRRGARACRCRAGGTAAGREPTVARL